MIQNMFSQAGFNQNRKTRREPRKGKKRGVGWTRQFSSARAREKFGNLCKGIPESFSKTVKKLSDSMSKMISPEELEAEEKINAIKEKNLSKPDLSAVAVKILNLNAKDAIKEIKTGNWYDYKVLLLTTENQNKNRKTVLDAINSLEG